MSAGWQVFLFLFILGMTAQTFNTFGIWSPQYPNAGFTIDSSTVTSAQGSAQDAPIGIFVIYQWVVTFAVIIGSGITAVFSLGILFYGMGWPVGVLGAALLTLIQVPATLISLTWVYELWTGRVIG